MIVDQSLPGEIEGDEFIQLVQSQWPAIASILTSGYLIDPTQVPTSTIFLNKPWPPDDLIISVATVLQPSQPVYKTTDPEK